MESEGSVQLMTPLTARIYLEAYYSLSDPKTSQDLRALVDELNAWDIIPVATLQNTWPEREWQEPESIQGNVDEMGVRKREKSETGNPGELKSLRDGAMVTMIQALLDGSDDTTNLLSEAELLTDFLPRLKGKIYEQSSSLKPSPPLLDLVRRALEEDTDVDLSPFKEFSAQDMSNVVSHLQQHGKMQTLCISNRPDFTAEDLQILLRVAPDLKALYILEDPQIPAQAVSSHIKNCDLFNSDLLRYAINPEPPRSKSDPDVLQKFYEENDVSQLVWIGVTDQQALDKGLRLESGLIDWASLEQDKRRSHWGWSERGLRYKRYPLDIPLPTLRMVAGLLCLLKWGSHARVYDVESFSSGAAFSFAKASIIATGSKLGISSTSDCGEKEKRSPRGKNEPGASSKTSGYGLGSHSTCERNGLGIGPLVPALYRSHFRDYSHENVAHEQLQHDRWAIILIHEAWDAMDQKSLDKRQRGPDAQKDSDSEEEETPLGLPKGGEQSFSGMLSRLLGPRDPFENRGKNQNLPFRAIKRLRYALVTPHTEPDPSGHDYIVADIPTYLGHVMGKDHGDYEKMVEMWNSGVAAIDGVGFYADEDIHIILPKVFPGKDKDASGSGSKQDVALPVGSLGPEIGDLARFGGVD